LIRLVLFDVDGVLLDSLAPHLQICQDKSREYGLDLAIPSEAELCTMIKQGVVISPMVCFFKAVGFPDHLAARADDEYRQTFMKRYAPRPFAGIHDMLGSLHRSGLTLGLVTSNVRSNVEGPLGASMAFFRDDCIFAKDSSADFTKASAIEDAIRRCAVGRRETVYVGDQPADVQAAAQAGVSFLGAAYGWGISSDEDGVRTVDTVAAITPAFLRAPRWE
jgi:phosphoglycolate phosphatase-like HAD superfamily hydrolase